MEKKTSRGRRAGIACMALGLLLIAAAAALLIHNEKENRDAGKMAQEELQRLRQELPEGDDRQGADDSLLGSLTIPALGLELPVMDEWSYENLEKAPCRYFGSLQTNDLVICGHNYTTHFGPLRRLEQGDQVLLTSADGAVRSYKVAKVETLQPEQVEEMIESPYDLTLYTCTYGGQSRVTVRCQADEAGDVSMLEK